MAMDLKEAVRHSHTFAKPYRVVHGRDFKLGDYDPEDTLDLKSGDKPRAQALLAEGVETLARLQERLYAQDRWAVLLIFQAMDAAGKDGAIKHVMSGLNPQGCEVTTFKAPSSEDLDHDYLWRCQKALPRRGEIGIFNRSYYEEVLAVRVHPEYLQKQKLPPELLTRKIWKHRFEDIRRFEHYLARNGIVILKFYLNLSKGEQRRRFLERIDNPDKNWKLSPTDAQSRGFWKEYMEAYQDLIRHTATKHAPWYVVPADNKWFTRLVVAYAVVEALAELDLRFPTVTDAQRKALRAVRSALLRKS